jgi:SAM-dependent methyltransferase
MNPTTKENGMADGSRPITVLADPVTQYRDGAESRVLEIIEGSSDLASTTGSLLAQASGWAERYHLDPARANVVRALDLPSDAVVLEVGAGCGAISRYLGETVAEVDALEPASWRAEVCRARTRDQQNVNVLVGEVSDLPAGPRYDVILIVGVLEYVGNGSLDDGPYARFLDECRSRLREGGSIIIAIENKLGVKYLAGAPEDHYALPFVGVEGYGDVSGLARTFSRSELGDLLAGSGLASRSLVAFPDYKLTRAVFEPESFGAEDRELLWTVPVFPSPDWYGQRAPAADERRLWRSMVEAGLAAEGGNSFVFIAGNAGETRAPIWPEARSGRFFSRDRQPVFGTDATIVRTDSGHRIDKVPSIAERADDGPYVVASSTPFVPGRDLVDALADGDVDSAESFVRRWAELVRQTVPETGSFDLLPHNVRVTSQDELVVIDDEWHAARADPESVVQRGVLLTAMILVSLREGIDWPRVPATGRAFAELLGSWSGLEADGTWLAGAVAAEAEFQEKVLLKSAENSLDGTEQRRAAIDAALDAAGPLSPSEAEEAEHAAAAEWEAEQAAAAEWEAGQATARAALEAEQLERAAYEEKVRQRLVLGEAALLRMNELEKELADRLAEVEAQHRAHNADLDARHAQHVAEVEARSAQRIHQLEQTEAELRGILAISRKSLVRRVIKKLR